MLDGDFSHGFDRAEDLADSFSLSPWLRRRSLSRFNGSFSVRVRGSDIVSSPRLLLHTFPLSAAISSKVLPVTADTSSCFFGIRLLSPAVFVSTHDVFPFSSPVRSTSHSPFSFFPLRCT